jgi:hypothetical protein
MTLRRAARDTLRMAQWLAVAIGLYFLTFDFGLQESAPGLQATIYTIANITLRAWIGYWIARSALGRLKMDGTDAAGKLIARAIIIAAAVMTSR